MGNTADGNGGVFTYSSRNMMLSATVSSATTRYQYDAAGQRALKSGPAGQSYYIHGPGGLLLAEYAGSFSKEGPWAGTTGPPCANNP